jgi:hypothetical protein
MMRLHTWRGMLCLGLLLGGLALGAATICPARDDQKGDGGKDQPKPTQLKLEKYKKATAINFAGALKLPFESLSSLGHRIEQARKDSDPVALAAIANELRVAEKVSGKKAEMTSQDVGKEALDLAVLRGVPEELQALSLMTDDTTAQTRLKSEIDSAKKCQAEEREQAKAVANGEKPRALRGTLLIVNQTDDELQIRVNGVPRARSFAHSTSSITVFDPPGTTTRLEAFNFFEGLKGFSTVEQNVGFKVFLITEN